MIYNLASYFYNLIRKNPYGTHKIIVKKQGTPGDSFGFHASNNYLKKKFNNYKFFSLEEGLINFFEWIDTVPCEKNLKYFHPLKKNIR